METAQQNHSSTGYVADTKDRLTRFFSWSMVMFLFAYLINNTLVHSKKWPGASSVFESVSDWRVWVQLGIYLAAFLIAWFIVIGRKRHLRADAATITAFNTCLLYTSDAADE